MYAQRDIGKQARVDVHWSNRRRPPPGPTWQGSDLRLFIKWGLETVFSVSTKLFDRALPHEPEPDSERTDVLPTNSHAWLASTC